MDEPRPRGLRAIQAVREGRGVRAWLSPRLWLYVGIFFAAWAIWYWKRSQDEIARARNELLARQRAVSVELGPRFLPLRDRIERWVQEAAGPFPGELIAPELPAFPFRTLPGIYVRLHLEEARDVESIRRAANDSLRDGFTSCLMLVPNPSPLSGAPCKRSRDCPPRHFCNQDDRCTPPAQPFNLRVAYRTTRILNDAWVRDVEDASNDIRLKALREFFDDAVADDLPLAIELMTRAQYFLLVLDEPVPVPVPAAPGEKPGEALQAVPHPARVFVYRLADERPLLRLRREVSGELIGPAASDADVAVLHAMKRQANNCALAGEVRVALGDTQGTAYPPAELVSPPGTSTAAAAARGE